MGDEGGVIGKATEALQGGGELDMMKFLGGIRDAMEQQIDDNSKGMNEAIRKVADEYNYSFSSGSISTASVKLKADFENYLKDSNQALTQSFEQEYKKLGEGSMALNDSPLAKFIKDKKWGLEEKQEWTNDIMSLIGVTGKQEYDIKVQADPFQEGVFSMSLATVLGSYAFDSYQIPPHLIWIPFLSKSKVGVASEANLRKTFNGILSVNAFKYEKEKWWLNNPKIRRVDVSFPGAYPANEGEVGVPLLLYCLDEDGSGKLPASIELTVTLSDSAKHPAHATIHLDDIDDLQVGRYFTLPLKRLGDKAGTVTVYVSLIDFKKKDDVWLRNNLRWLHNAVQPKANKESDISAEALKSMRVVQAEEWGKITESAGFKISDVEFMGCITEEETDTSLHIWVSENYRAICVAFRGTEQSSWKNVLTDTLINLYPFDDNIFENGVEMDINKAQGISREYDGKDTLLVHYGFIRAYSTIRHTLVRLLHKLIDDKPYRIVLTGHSLGGALTTVAGLDLSREFPDREMAVYSYGSPKVGNERFAELYNKTVPNTYRVVNGADLCPRMPRGPYRHVGKAVLINSEGVVDDFADCKEENPLQVQGDSMWSSLEKFIDEENKLLQSMIEGESLAHHMEDAYYLSLTASLKSMRDNPPKYFI
mmetsp:Transcript_5501/g.14367  ORF Transcript_5501/g.14367 Transcript_5501/m.14367 type:complete len:650 (+) Transcript_5501:3-1952(+)